MTGQDRATTVTVRVRLPAQLRILAGVPGEAFVEVTGAVTQRSVLDALETAYPMLRGTTRERATGKRRAFIRFFVGEADLSNLSPDAVARGQEAQVVVGAMAGG